MRVKLRWKVRIGVQICESTGHEVKWSEVAQSCLTLCDPMDCSLPGSSVHGIFQARILEWVTISFSRGTSWPRDRTRVSGIVGRRLAHVIFCVRKRCQHQGHEGGLWCFLVKVLWSCLLRWDPWSIWNWFFYVLWNRGQGSFFFPTWISNWLSIT